MYAPPGVKINHNEFPIPKSMEACVCSAPGRSRARVYRSSKVAVYCGPNDLCGLSAWGEGKGGKWCEDVPGLGKIVARFCR